MLDRREAIIERLVVVCGSVEGIVSAHRHKVRVAETEKPAVIVYDADEVAEEVGHSRPPGAPEMVTLSPEIYVILAETPERVGSDLNAIRRRIYRAVKLDSELNALTYGGDGDIRYEGCATGLSLGRSMEGEMVIQFLFRYVLDSAELEEPAATES